MSSSNTPSPRRGRERWSGVTGGVVLIAVGVAFLLAELHLLSTRHFWRWAPLVLVVLGAGKILTASSFARVKGGLVLTLLGGWLLLNTHEVGFFHWGNSWPLLLIGFGAIAVLEAIVKGFGFDRLSGGDRTIYGAVAEATFGSQEPRAAAGNHPDGSHLVVGGSGDGDTAPSGSDGTYASHPGVPHGR
jgi:hypothetical protein